MKVVSSGFGRPLPWLVVLLCLAGGVFATENNWLTSLRVGHNLTTWLARLIEDEPSERLVIADTPTKPPDTNYQVNSWFNAALFSPASTGWTLSARPFGGGIIEPGQQSTASNAPYSANLPAAVFSSGFMAYTTGEFGPMPAAPTASGTWSANSSGNWSNSANWQGGTIADGVDNSASFNTLNITSDVTVTLDTSRTIGNVSIGDTDGTHRYTLNASGGSSLTFDSGVVFISAVLQQSSTSAGDTISVPILMNTDLDINNLSATNQLTISGNISGNGGDLYFNTQDNPNAAGDILVSGNISNGSLSVRVGVLRGTVTLTGTNTHTGGTSVQTNGTLLLNGNNGGATGSVFVGSGGTLGGTGSVGGSVDIYDGTITGGTVGTVGTLTLSQNVSLSTGEGTGIYWADISGSTSDLLAIAGTLTLGNPFGSDSKLVVSGALDGITTYTIATFGHLVGGFEFGSFSGIPSNYTLVYNDMNIQLVPTAIPEPSTWIGGALALGVIAFAIRKRKLRRA